jgi:hypothetical protein
MHRKNIVYLGLVQSAVAGIHWESWNVFSINKGGTTVPRELIKHYFWVCLEGYFQRRLHVREQKGKSIASVLELDTLPPVLGHQTSRLSGLRTSELTPEAPWGV